MASTDKHYNPAIEARLRGLIASRDWTGVLRYLATLSHSSFRTAGYMLGETLMQPLSDTDFWTFAEALVRSNSKAFLVTLLKGAILRGVDVDSAGFASFCAAIREGETDVRKTLLLLLPQMSDPQSVSTLFSLLDVADAEKRVSFLLRVPTPAASFVLLLTLRSLDHNRQVLLRTVAYLMKRGDDRSFNLASLLKTYFGLEEVRGTFSRPVEPYQLARLDSSYEAFCEALNR